MFRKWSTSFCVYNILIATHLQPEYTTNTHETHSEHSVRRRSRFIVPVSSYYQICVPLPHFVGVHVYAGTINRPLRLLTVCHNVANGLEFCGCLRICKYQKIVHQRTLATRYGTTTYTKCLLSHCKNHTFAM